MATDGNNTGRHWNSGSLILALRALRHHNYGLYFFGQSIPLIGTWMTRVSTSWLVYRLTNSALLLDLMSFAGQLPTTLVTETEVGQINNKSRHLDIFFFDAKPTVD